MKILVAGCTSLSLFVTHLLEQKHQVALVDSEFSCSNIDTFMTNNSNIDFVAMSTSPQVLKSFAEKNNYELLIDFVNEQCLIINNLSHVFKNMGHWVSMLFKQTLSWPIMLLCLLGRKKLGNVQFCGGILPGIDMDELSLSHLPSTFIDSHSALITGEPSYLFCQQQWLGVHWFTHNALQLISPLISLDTIDMGGLHVSTNYDLLPSYIQVHQLNQAKLGIKNNEESLYDDYQCLWTIKEEDASSNTCGDLQIFIDAKQIQGTYYSGMSVSLGISINIFIETVINNIMNGLEDLQTIPMSQSIISALNLNNYFTEIRSEHDIFRRARDCGDEQWRSVGHSMAV